MTVMLKISILMNCLLLCGWLLSLAGGRRTHSVAIPPAQPDEAPSAVEAAVPATAAPAKGDERSFNWSQVESSDYRTYIANLRGIGCPEQTIRDIITADVDSQYASRRETIEQKLTGHAVAERPALENGLRAMRKEEASLIAELLGAPTSVIGTPSVAADDPASASVRQEPAGTTVMRAIAQDVAASSFSLNTRSPDLAPGIGATASTPKASAAIPVPLVLQPIDPSVVRLNPEQAQAVDNLRQKFIDDVGGPNQDPNDPAYGQRWQTSQPQADLDLRGMIGIRAWEAYQISAWAKSNEQTPSGP